MIERFENLIAVPSFHFDPLFAQQVRTAFRGPLDVVALEYWPDARSALAWAASLWPCPVATVYPDHAVLPLVPGDSMLEAYRLASERGIPVELIDLPVARYPQQRGAVPGPELEARVGTSFSEVLDQLRSAEVAPEDLAREAAMARALRELMRQHTSVLWVGGMAHWSRLKRRLETGDLGGPEVPLVESMEGRGVRIEPMALRHLTGRTPYLVRTYAEELDNYDEDAAVRRLCLEATRDSWRARSAGTTPAVKGRVDAVGEEPEGPADIARVLLYARNIAATSGLRDRPSLDVLLTSADACVGRRYTARLMLRSLEQEVPAKLEDLPALDYVFDDDSESYTLDGEEVGLVPLWRIVEAPFGWRWSMTEAERVLSGQRQFDLAPHKGRKKKGSEKILWVTPIEYDRTYRAYGEYLMRIAGGSYHQEHVSEPFLDGLYDGVDARETLRHWMSDEVFIKRRQRDRLHFRHVLVDYSSDREGSDQHAGIEPSGKRGGWTDPSMEIFGSVSRTESDVYVQEEPFRVQQQWRSLSFLSLNTPTWIRKDDSKSLYGRVIKRLVDQAQESEGLDTFPNWFEIFCEFCRGKPLAMFTRYVPSETLRAIARRQGVRLVHVPLAKVPGRVLNLHRSFYFLAMTKRQWLAWEKLRAEDRAPYIRRN